MTAGARLRVLLVEDDPAMAAGIVRGLRDAGMDVELATDGDAGARVALAGDFGAIVLDLSLPSRGGIEVLEILRGRVVTPVLVLTARSDLDDRLRCFALGAADFVAKPFWIEELVARIRSRTSARPTAAHRRVAFADVEADLDARTLRVAGAPVELTRNEWAILAHLLERPGRAVARSQLASDALDAFDGAEARTVDSHVAHLRKKLGAEGRAFIATAWGIGYRFDPPEDAR